MSWYISHLLRNKVSIRSRARKEPTINDTYLPNNVFQFYYGELYDVDDGTLEVGNSTEFSSDDEYNDLLVVENKCRELYEHEIITDKDLRLMDYMSDGKPIVNSKKEFGKNRLHLAKDFANLCNKISFYLGGYFTDEGYVHELKTKYHLTDEQVDTVLDYMNSRYKNKLIRKQKKTQ